MNIRQIILVVIFIIGVFFGLFLADVAIGSPIPNPYEQIEQQLKTGNVEGAIARLTPMAQSGDSTADWLLVRIYVFGPPQYRNVGKGIESLLRLSARGNPDSKEVLGDLYYYGDLVPQDYKKAAEWYADYVKYERDSDILTKYALLFAMGNGVKQNKSKAFKLLNEAVDKGYIPAFLLAREVYQSMNFVERFLLRQSY